MNCRRYPILLLLLVLSIAGLILAGCAGSGAPAIEEPKPATSPVISPAPVSTQMLQAVPELKSARFTDLLNFESRSDTVFVSASGLKSEWDDAQSHTGRASARLSGTSGKLTVKLASLLSSTRKFPDNWTLAGAYFYSDLPGHVLVSCEIGGTVIARASYELAPGKWTAVMADLANPASGSERASGAPLLSFTIDLPQNGDVWCDDVVLVDNTQWLVGRPDASQPGQWSVSRRGLNYICGVSDEFTIRLTPADVLPSGWKLEEANAIRARLSSSGKNRYLTIYSDGRSYWDGAYRPLAAGLRTEPLWADQQLSPALIEVPEAMGRLDRRSPGDENNDGYNEARASYMIIAAGPRLEVLITPRSTPVLRPLLEITGLPPGEALVTVEGKLVDRTLRLPDGTLLVEIPGRVDRATTVNLRIQ